MGFNVNELKDSKFLTQEDVNPPKVVTIKSCQKEDVSMESQPTKIKWVMSFQELDKPLVLNVTNGKRMAKLFDSDESDDWIGKKVMLYNDKMVEFAGEITGGIRVRQAQSQEDVDEFDEAMNKKA